MSKNKPMKTEEDIEQEISRLKGSYYVKLAKKEERVRYRRRQYAYTLRMYEKKGKQLAALGVTIESLDELDESVQAPDFQTGEG